MKRAVYYFSGTGNTLCVARDLAARLHAALIPIAAFWNRETAETDAELIGIVFPVYYGDMPLIVQEFVVKLQNLQNKRVFAVCTYGGAVMDTLRTLRRLLQECGGKLSLAFGVPMPQNSFNKWYESRKRRYAVWPKTCKTIVRRVETGAQGIRYHNVLLELVMIPATKFLIKPLCRRLFLEKSGLPGGTPAPQAMRRMDQSYTALSVCNGCGICAKVCPVENIVITEGKPVWQGRCEHCLACYSWCPRQAIAGGVAQKGFFYRHPGVSVKDFLRTS